MSAKRMSVCFLAGGMAAVLTGCMPKMTVEEMKAMMPSRPAALDRLNQLVGEWQQEAKVTFSALDAPLTMKARTTAAWEGDGWYLVERGTYSMEGFDDMKGITIWTYDTARDRFRVTWVDSMGAVGHGTARFDEKTNTFKMRVENETPFGTSVVHGTITMVDTDTQRWTWSESAFLGLMHIMDMEVTGKRR